MGHIDKGKTDTTLSAQIFWKIKIVVLIVKFLIDYFHHIHLIELDWYISDH